MSNEQEIFSKENISEALARTRTWYNKKSKSLIEEDFRSRNWDEPTDTQIEDIMGNAFQGIKMQMVGAIRTGIDSRTSLVKKLADLKRQVIKMPEPDNSPGGSNHLRCFLSRAVLDVLVNEIATVEGSGGIRKLHDDIDKEFGVQIGA